MHKLISKSTGASALYNAIKARMFTSILDREGYLDKNVDTLVTNQAVSDNLKIEEAISLIESYQKMGVTVYDDRLKHLLTHPHI